MSEKYPLLRKLGAIHDHSDSEGDYVQMADLESILQKATVVYGCSTDIVPGATRDRINKGNMSFDTFEINGMSTHKGLLICLEEIKPKEAVVTSKRIDETFEKLNLFRLDLSYAQFQEKFKKELGLL